MLPKYMQDAYGLNFVGSPSQTFQHPFNIVLSCQSTFDGSIQCLPHNLGIPFLPQWLLQVPLRVFFIDCQHFAIT
jgi:hypothetical protein